MRPVWSFSPFEGVGLFLIVVFFWMSLVEWMTTLYRKNNHFFLRKGIITLVLFLQRRVVGLSCNMTLQDRSRYSFVLLSIRLTFPCLFWTNVYYTNTYNFWRSLVPFLRTLIVDIVPTSYIPIMCSVNERVCGRYLLTLTFNFVVNVIVVL